MPRIKVTISTGKVGSQVVGYVNIDPDELEMIECDEQTLGEIATEKMWEMIDFHYEIVD